MAAPTYPAVPTAQGNVKVAFTSTVNASAPSVAALTAAGSLDISCFLHRGAWTPNKESNKGTSPARLCDTRQFEKFGLTTESVGDLTYAIDPQAAPGSDGKKAYETLAEGATGYFVERMGIDSETDFAVGDLVRVIPVVLGPRNPTGDTSDEFAEFTVTQAVAVQPPGASDFVALVA